MVTDVTSIRALFVRFGFRWTRQREAVYAALCQSTTHPTAYELYRSVHAVDSGVSLATIYNTLDSLASVGLCRRIAPARSGQNSGGHAGTLAARFDADMSDHAHLLTRDGRVEDLPDDLSSLVLSHIPRSVLDEVERRTGKRVSRVSVELMEESASKLAAMV